MLSAICGHCKSGIWRTICTLSPRIFSISQYSSVRARLVIKVHTLRSTNFIRGFLFATKFVIYIVIHVNEVPLPTK